MSNLDDKIRAALRANDDAEELMKEPRLLAEVIAPFRGRNRWINALGLVYGILGLALLAWSIFAFLEAETTRSQLIWCGVGVFALMFVSFMKVFFWMEMHTKRVLREVKRVELLIVSTTKNS